VDQIEHLNIPSNYIEAGKQYIETAQKLGLELEFAAWSCVDNSDFRLVMVSDWAARFGSRQLHELLTNAYFAHALPQEIDPFMVEIFTPKSHLGAELLNTPTISFLEDGSDGARVLAKGVELRLSYGAYVWAPEWRYQVRAHKRSSDDLRRFRRFERNVRDLLAA
jgi:hypothetical protein